MIRICEDAVIVVPPMVNQRRSGEGHPFATDPGTCAGHAGRPTAFHPHQVRLTAVQTILVADRDFVAAWARCA